MNDKTETLQLIDMKKVRAVHFEQLQCITPSVSTEPHQEVTIPHSPEKSSIKSTIPAKSLEDMVYKGAAVTIGNQTIKCRHGLLEEFRKNKNMNMKTQAPLESLKTTKSCLLINTSEDYTWLFLFGIALLITSIIECLLCLLSVSCFVLIPVMHKRKRNKIKKEIEKNKSSYTYIIEGKINRLEAPSPKELCEHKYEGNSYTILCNHFSIDSNGTAYVIRDHSTISDPDAKILIDKTVSETIRIYYDQITDIKTGKILHSAELKQFLYEEKKFELLNEPESGS